jgi:hypothetical protein
VGLLEVIGYFLSDIQRHIPSPTVGSLVVVKSAVCMKEEDWLLELRLIEVLDCLTLLRIDSQCGFLPVILDPEHLAPGLHKRELFVDVGGCEVRLLCEDERIPVLYVFLVEILGVPERIHTVNEGQINPEFRPSANDN